MAGSHGNVGDNDTLRQYEQCHDNQLMTTSDPTNDSPLSQTVVPVIDLATTGLLSCHHIYIISHTNHQTLPGFFHPYHHFHFSHFFASSPASEKLTRFKHQTYNSAVFTHNCSSRGIFQFRVGSSVRNVRYVHKYCHVILLLYCSTIPRN